MISFPGRILVADHTGKLDRFVCRVLGQDKWFIEHAESSYDLDKSVFSQPPHILILNSHLPNLNIRDFIQELENRFGSEKPVVILAIFKDVDKRLKKGFSAGADEFLRVPFHAVELAAKINAAMKQVYMRYEHARIVEDLTDQLSENNQSSPQVQGNQHAELDEPVTSMELRGPVISPPTEEAPETTKFDTDIAAISRSIQSTTKPTVAPVIPMFPELSEEPEPTQAAAIDLGSSGPPIKRDPRHKRERIPQIRLDLPKPPINAFNLRSGQDASIRKKLTLMLVRINGLDSINEDLEPKDSAAITQEIYSEIIRNITRFGGQAIGIQGDSLLATFTTTPEQSNHQLGAVQASLQLQILSMFLDEKLPDLGIHVDLSVAIHTGSVTQTSFDNSKGKKEASVIGSAVTIVSRLLNHCEPGEVIVSCATYEPIADVVLTTNERELPVGRSGHMIKTAHVKGMNAAELALAANTEFGLG